MPRRIGHAFVLILFCSGFSGQIYAQKALSWSEVLDLFRKNNPGLAAGRIGVQEFQANEISAGLRPNPVFSTVNDQVRVFSPGSLDAQKSYRDIQLNYRNLIGSYLAAANQLNLAVGREVIP